MVFRQFRLDKAGRRDSGNLGRGIYLTKDPTFAMRYAEANTKKWGGEPVVLKVVARINKIADFYKMIPQMKEELGVKFPPKGQDLKRSEKLRQWFIGQGFDAAEAGSEIVVFEPKKLNIVGQEQVKTERERLQAILQHFKETGEAPLEQDPKIWRRADYQQDEKSRSLHISKGLRGFKVLLRKVAPYADTAKAEHFKDSSRQKKYFTKLIKDLPSVKRYLSKYIGTSETHRQAYSWRNAVLYALRDHLITEVPLKDAMAKVEKQLSKGFQALEMERAQSPLKVIPPQLRQFLPNNIVVEVDPTNNIKKITDRFENERLTLDVKRQKMISIIKDYNKIVRKVRKDLRSKDELTQLAALVTSIIMETGIRPGRRGNFVPIDDIDVETFGAVTLGPSHVRFIRKNFAELEFVGKQGSVNTAALSNSQIIKVLKDYVDRALKKGVSYAFVTKDGTPFTYTDLQRYFRNRFKKISPTDFRKLRATQVVLDNLVEQQETLYRRISQFLDLEEDLLKERIIEEITTTLDQSIEAASKALSHDSSTTTRQSYIDPQVILRFLSKGKIENTLKGAILNNETTLTFSPKPFIEQARNRLAALKGVDYEGNEGSQWHATRVEKGTVPLTEVSKLKSEGGEIRKWWLRDGDQYFGNYRKDRWQDFLADIKRNGMQDPIEIWVKPGKPPQIREGNHRLQAALQLRLREVPVIITYYGHTQRDVTVGPSAKRVIRRYQQAALKTAARPIRLDRREIQRVTKKAYEAFEKILERAPDNAAFVSAFSRDYYESRTPFMTIQLKNVRGEDITAKAFITFQPSRNAALTAGITHEGEVHFRANSRMRKGTLLKRIKKELPSIVAHEMTHLADIISKVEYNSGDAEDGIITKEDHARKYFNDPVEVRAWMRQVYEEIRDEVHRKQRGPHNLGKAITQALKRNLSWKDAEPYLNRESRNRILKGLVTTFEDDILKVEMGLPKAARRVLRRYPQNHKGRAILAGSEPYQKIQAIVDHLYETGGLDEPIQVRYTGPIGRGDVHIDLMTPSGRVGFFFTGRVAYSWDPIEGMKLNPECKEAYRKIRGKNSDVELWSLEASNLKDKRLWNKGIGKLAYEQILKDAGSYGAVVVPHWCLKGGSTSNMAKRVWDSLKRRYKSEGPIVIPKTLRLASLIDQASAQNPIYQNLILYHGSPKKFRNFKLKGKQPAKIKAKGRKAVYLHSDRATTKRKYAKGGTGGTGNIGYLYELLVDKAINYADAIVSEGLKAKSKALTENVYLSLPKHITVLRQFKVYPDGHEELIYDRSKTAARPIRLPTRQIKELAKDLARKLKMRGLPRPNRVVAEEWLSLPNVKGDDVDVEIMVAGSPKVDFDKGDLIQGAYLKKSKPPLPHKMVVYVNSFLPRSSFEKRPNRIIEDELYRILTHELTHAADIWSGKGSVGDLSKSKEDLLRHHHNHPTEVKALMRDVVTDVEPTVRDYLEAGMPFNTAVRYALKDSKWVDIEPYLKPLNKKTILKGVYTHLQDQGLGVRGKRAKSAYDPTSWYYDYEPSLTLETILDRWQQQDPRQKLYDKSQPFMVPLRKLWPLREYTWTRDKARAGFARVGGKSVWLDGPLKWDSIKEDMRGRGWDKSDPLILTIGHKGVKVGEGNHRLAIARELGFREVPVKLLYQSGSVTKSPMPSQDPVVEVAPKAVKRVIKNDKDPTPEAQQKIDEIMSLLRFGSDKPHLVEAPRVASTYMKKSDTRG